MQPEKWEETKGQLQDAFKDVEFSKDILPEPQKGEMEIALFDGPMGKMRLEYITRPVILDKRTHTSRRIGANVGVEYVYSDTEFTHKLVAYRFDDDADDWQEIDMKESFQL